ncbi:heterokaryon incompatibility protein-domain-containing protein, partial [Bipolaris maydis]
LRMYSPLNTSRKEIRLLHIHPGNWNDGIECHMETVSLKDYPKFQAISYVWGDTTNKLSITVDGKYLAVTQNVVTGLQRLRATGETLALWLDAVCINQSDIHERSEQVQCMREIYSSADEVFIWLGYGRNLHSPSEQPDIVRWTGEDEDLEIVDSYFKQGTLQNSPNEEGNETEDVVGLFVYMKLRAMNKHVHEIPFFDVKGGKLQAGQSWLAIIQAMHTLSSHPWWTRIWVVQETILARKATVLYGKITVPWTLVGESTRAAARHIHCCGDLHQARGGRELRAIVELRKARYDDLEWLRAARAQKKKLSLYQVMSRTYSRNATDVRDEVFGVLGLVTDWLGQSPLIPDYDLSPCEVFMRVVTKHIQSTLSLHILMGTTRTGIPHVPSWVTQRGRTSQSSSSATGYRINRAVLFSAAGGRPASVRRASNVLITDAFEPSLTVSQVGSTLPGNHNWRELIDCIASWRHMAQLENPTDHTLGLKNPQNEAFWRTIIHDSWQPQRMNSVDILSAQLDFSGEVFTAYRRCGDTDVNRIAEGFWDWAQSQAKGDLKKSEEHTSSMNEIKAFYHSLLGAILDRRFFIASNGCMGMGPPEMQPGDSIVILLGSTVPFCIRAMQDAPNGNYRLVGDAYVHGLMDGEGVPNDCEEKIVQIHIH